MKQHASIGTSGAFSMVTCPVLMISFSCICVLNVVKYSTIYVLFLRNRVTIALRAYRCWWASGWYWWR
jgi:hypothetical protein